MEGKKRFIVKIFILLFHVSISVSVISCPTICVYGLLGEVKAAGISKDADKTVIETDSQLIKRAESGKGENIFNIMFAIMAITVFTKYKRYSFRLPCSDTIVSLKVRMDN